MLWRIQEFLDWFFYFRKGKLKFTVLDFGNTYNASVTDGKVAIVNCYGSTKEAAKEVALFKLKQHYAQGLEEYE